MSERVKTDSSVRLIVKIMVAVVSSDDVSVTTRYLASLSPATLGPACIGEMGSDGGSLWGFPNKTRKKGVYCNETSSDLELMNYTYSKKKIGPDSNMDDLG